MTKHLSTTLNRRQFVISSGLAVASTASFGLFAKEKNTVSADSLIQEAIIIAREEHDHFDQLNDLTAPLTVIQLNGDPVRQWRNQIKQIINDKQQPLIGYSTWSDYIIMQGLASELRYYPRYLQQHKLSDLSNEQALTKQTNVLLNNVKNISFKEQLLAPNHSEQILFSWVIS